MAVFSSCCEMLGTFNPVTNRTLIVIKSYNVRIKTSLYGPHGLGYRRATIVETIGSWFTVN